MDPIAGININGDSTFALTAHALLGDGEHLAFSDLEQLARRFAFVIEDRGCDIGARPQQLA